MSTPIWKCHRIKFVSKCLGLLAASAPAIRLPLVCLLVLVSSIVTSIKAADAKTPAVSLDQAQLKAQAERCRKLLRTSLVDFYLPNCVDGANGGYKESLKDGAFVLTGEKFLTLQARQLWFFSTLALEGIEREASLKAARSGFEFLQNKMFDPEFGGYYSKVADDGGTRDQRKHIYLNSFVIYGLSAYYQATKDPAALKAAQDLFKTLEKNAHDQSYGGYTEFFYRDWKPITDPKEPGYVGAIGVKTYNTHLHLLESFTELYRIWPDEVLRKRVEELLLININTVRHAKYDCNVDAWHQNWTVVNEPRNLRASYGHDVECVWLGLDAARTIQLSSSLLRNWGESLCHNSIGFGYDHDHGGFYSSGPLGKPADDTKKIWWVQAEALVSMLEMCRLTGDKSYYDLFAQTLDFVEKFQVAKEGSWWATRAPDGALTSDRQRSSPWQGAYHAGRSMILCARLLDELASQGHQ